jgi:uncharacterized protein
MLAAFAIAYGRTMITLSSLHIYPIKGIAGITLEQALVEPRGLQHDRRWLLVDADGRFLSQRELPLLGQIQARAFDNAWQLSAPAMPPLLLQEPADGQRLPVTVWSDTVNALLADNAANDWFSRVLGQPTRAVYMDAAARRSVDADYSQAGDEVSFADAYPLLIATTASLADLNARIGEPLTMARFRPNLVLDGAEAWAEDGWSRIRIGELEIDLVKPCSRCQVTTLDPGSGAVHPRSEPLRTLATFRRRNLGDKKNLVMFAVNAIARGRGRLQRGQSVEVLA